jgi:hypothetical protein
LLREDDEHDAVFEDDQVRTSAATARNLELQHVGEPHRVGQALAQLVAQRAKRAIPRDELGRSGLSGERGELAEDLVLRRVQERLDVAEPGVGKVSHSRR